MNVIILGSGSCVSAPRARGNTIAGDILKAGFILNEDNPLRKELFTLNEIDTIRNQYRISLTIPSLSNESLSQSTLIIDSSRDMRYTEMVKNNQRG